MGMREGGELPDPFGPTTALKFAANGPTTTVFAYDLKLCSVSVVRRKRVSEIVIFFH